MSLRLLPSLVIALAVPLAFACSGEEPANDTDSGGAGGAMGGSAGTGGATGGSAGTATTGGSAGVGGATGGSAGTGTAGTGTAGTGTAGTGSGATDSPSDTSQAGLEGFLTAMSYRGMDWKSGADMPAMGTSLHGLNRIWYNKTLRTSAAANNSPHTTGSMVVKEIYTGTEVIGRAAMLRTATGWIYYCTAGEAGRCTTSSMPNQASYAMTAGSCACHGAGTIVTGDMIPPP